MGRNGAFASASDDRAAGSRLSAIVLQHLRQQHKIACLSAQQPVSTLPPLSLTHTNVLPQVTLASPFDSLPSACCRNAWVRSVFWGLLRGQEGVGLAGLAASLLTQL